jgi:hypothetical protein
MSIVEWMKLMMCFCKELFLQVIQKFISHLKIVWHRLSIMVLLVLGIGILQNILNLLVDVLGMFNEPDKFVGFSLSMGKFYLGGRKG